MMIIYYIRVINFLFRQLCQRGWACVRLTHSSSTLFKPSGKMYFMNEEVYIVPILTWLANVEVCNSKNILWALHINIPITIAIGVWSSEVFKLNINMTVLCSDWTSDWTMCLWNLETILSSIIKPIKRVDMNTYTLTCCNFCIWTPLEMIIFLICNYLPNCFF